jgi:methionine-rich copper-binding protein CopC
MKRAFFLPIIAATMLVTAVACAQDKAPASPPAKASEKISSGATVTINYSQPSVKGRTIGKDLEPMAGKVWRTGANEATVFETDKDVMIEGKKLPAGKYGLFTIAGDKEWTIIFNKTWKQWGAFKYSEADDALRVKVPVTKAAAFTEKFTINIDKSGKVSLLWGPTETDFAVK